MNPEPTRGMVDPFHSMAFAVHSIKGAYAVLLGSGVSKPSGIPTGWDIVLDLVRKTAKLQDEDCEPDPATWHEKKHGKAPNYSDLLGILAKTAAERQQLLRGYFESTAEERADGKKLPTSAHKSLAKLIEAGFIRVVVTTNFDRLMELALEELGIQPTVLSTTDQLKGALPLAHSGPTIIKLNGDYRDARIRNTEEELETYELAFAQFLDSVLDEYGLIVSGWSADWDGALRNALERCSNRRFTTFWGAFSPLGDTAGKLAMRRRAVILENTDADQLFGKLQTHIESLGDLTPRNPLSPKMAAATVKRYIVDPASRIRLHDLVHDETEALFTQLMSQDFACDRFLSNDQERADEIRLRVQKYETLSQTLLSMFIVGAYWGGKENCRTLVKALERVASSKQVQTTDRNLFELRLYPAMLQFYGAGVAAVAANNYSWLAEAFGSPQLRGEYEHPKPKWPTFAPWQLEHEFKLLPRSRTRNYETIGSEYLQTVLREPLRGYLPNEQDYWDCFDRFEYLIGLGTAMLKQVPHKNGWGGPVGCFGWRGRPSDHAYRIWKPIEMEFEAQQENWPPLKSGMLTGSTGEISAAIRNYNYFLHNHTSSWR